MNGLPVDKDKAQGYILTLYTKYIHRKCTVVPELSREQGSESLGRALGLYTKLRGSPVVTLLGCVQKAKVEKHEALATALGTQAETGFGQTEVGVQTMAMSYQ